MKVKKMDFEVRQIGNIRQIGNMDETPMFFDMPRNRTVDLKGNTGTSITVKTSGAEKKNHISLIVYGGWININHTEAFKRKIRPKEKNCLYSDLLVIVQQKCWTDEAILMEWLVSKGNLFDIYFTTLQLVLVPCGGGRTSPRTSP